MRQMEKSEEPPEWARDVPRKKIGIPYTFGELMSWLKNNAIGPSKKFKNLTDFIPQKSTQNAITPKIKLGFLGDIMQMFKKELSIDPNLKGFFKDCDFLIGNFEGTLVAEDYAGKKVWMRQTHSEKILSALETLFPPSKFVLANANNHAGDYGWSTFNKSYERLKDRSFLPIGRRDEPSIKLNDEVNVTTCTKWTNQPKTPYIIYLDEIVINPDAKFNILFPHWGYEMQLYPNSAQIELGEQLLEKWDLIVGHHSHCPQPITSYEMNEGNKVLAYSLGDFCTGLKMKKYHHGMVVKAEIGPGKDGAWKTGAVEWKFTRVHIVEKDQYEVRLEDACKYFKDK